MLKKSTTPEFPSFDRKKAELYLSDGEFLQVLGIAKSDFYQQPKWKQDSMKSKSKLL